MSWTACPATRCRTPSWCMPRERGAGGAGNAARRGRAAGPRSRTCSSMRRGRGGWKPGCKLARLAVLAAGDAVRVRAGGGDLQHHPPADPHPPRGNRGLQADRRHRLLHPPAFLYFGALQGLAGGVAAWAIIWAGLRLLNDAARRPVPALRHADRAAASRLEDSASLLLFSAGLGWFGAWLSVNQHLAESSPLASGWPSAIASLIKL